MAYLPHASDAFGEKGARAITRLLDAVKLIFQRFPPESLQSTLTVVLGMNTTPSAPMAAHWGAPISYQRYNELGTALASAAAGAHCLIELVPDGTFRFLELVVDIDLKAAAVDALVYRYDAGVDRIMAKDHDDYVQKVSPFLSSNFANATLSSLEEALSRYAAFVSETKCRILADVWEGGVNGPRLVLVNRPEAIMLPESEKIELRNRLSAERATTFAIRHSYLPQRTVRRCHSSRNDSRDACSSQGAPFPLRRMFQEPIPCLTLATAAATASLDHSITAKGRPMASHATTTRSASGYAAGAWVGDRAWRRSSARPR